MDLVDVSENFTPPAPGRYRGKITEASATTAKSSGAPMLTWVVELKNTPVGDISLYDNALTVNVPGAFIGKRKLRQLGMPVDRRDVTDDQVASMLLNLEVEVETDNEPLYDKDAAGQYTKPRINDDGTAALKAVAKTYYRLDAGAVAQPQPGLGAHVAGPPPGLPQFAPLPGGAPAPGTLPAFAQAGFVPPPEASASYPQQAQPGFAPQAQPGFQQAQPGFAQPPYVPQQGQVPQSPGFVQQAPATAPPAQAGFAPGFPQGAPAYAPQGYVPQQQVGGAPGTPNAALQNGAATQPAPWMQPAAQAPAAAEESKGRRTRSK